MKTSFDEKGTKVLVTILEDSKKVVDALILGQNVGVKFYAEDLLKLSNALTQAIVEIKS